MTSRSFRSRLSLLGVVLALTSVTACSGQQSSVGSGANPQGDPSQVSKGSAAKVVSSIKPGAKGVDLQRKLRLHVDSGTFETVQVTGPQGGVVQGRMSGDKTSWVSRTQLQAASRYRVTSTAVDSSGLRNSYESVFRTRALTLDEQTYPSFVPLEGQTVGVGMPVIVRFDVPVADQASIEKHLRVTSQPAQGGSFHWISSREVHWRPRTYWKPGTDVTVNADVGGVSAGNGIYGQESRVLKFHVGDSMVSKVDMNTHQMRVFRNGQQIRTIPITTGEQPKFTTRSGTKVIVEKFRHKRMNSETIGIDPASADGYNLDDVEYAMRVTYSGEFVHAAPWSVASQGHANVSHGCTGMSTANAAWLYNVSKVGDVIEYTGTDRGTDLTNGFGDWNAPFGDYRAGSALS
ncbi:MAG: ErfK/YbiS/YcfS/YnhG family protein [Marmoricola sp.]|nr:ErfK/YbiS/YcfS/YnhG family protein [Marmoricola sp.]